MRPAPAIKSAIDLVQVPSRVRSARSDPLPEGMEDLLRIAVGEEEITAGAAETTGRSPEFLREAATFFVEQILMAPGSDSYRILGATPEASSSELRRNMALLVRWLHPDVADDDPRAVFAQRVNSAWEDLKTAGRRQEYDAARETEAAATPLPTSRAEHRHGAARVRSSRNRQRPEQRRNAEGGPQQGVLSRLFGRVLGHH